MPSFRAKASRAQFCPQWSGGGVDRSYFSTVPAKAAAPSRDRRTRQGGREMTPGFPLYHGVGHGILNTWKEHAFQIL